MATKEISTPLKKSRYSSFIKDSGATYNNLVIPAVMSSKTCFVCVLFKDELRTCAIPSTDESPLIAST